MNLARSWRIGIQIFMEYCETATVALGVSDKMDKVLLNLLSNRVANLVVLFESLVHLFPKHLCAKWQLFYSMVTVSCLPIDMSLTFAARWSISIETFTLSCRKCSSSCFWRISSARSRLQKSIIRGQNRKIIQYGNAIQYIQSRRWAVSMVIKLLAY